MTDGSGRWFTNSRHPKADVADWMAWSVGSVVVIGPPRATETSYYCDKPSSVANLERMKMKGLYEVRAGVPPLPRAEDCPGFRRRQPT